MDTVLVGGPFCDAHCEIGLGVGVFPIGTAALSSTPLVYTSKTSNNRANETS